jgi:hypothetical protein
VAALEYEKALGAVELRVQVVGDVEMERRDRARGRDPELGRGPRGAAARSWEYDLGAQVGRERVERRHQVGIAVASLDAGEYVGRGPRREVDPAPNV